jgi:hypothetical protein
MKVGNSMPKSTNFAKEFKLFETLNTDEQSTELTEVVSSTYQATYDKLRKKFQRAEIMADKLWVKCVVDFGENSGYYNKAVAALIKAVAFNKINSGVQDVGLAELCVTDNVKANSFFDTYLNKETENFDSIFEDLYYENFICYTDGHFDYINLLEEPFTGNIDEIECVVGIDYASGANICWIRGEDGVEALEALLNI